MPAGKSAAAAASSGVGSTARPPRALRLDRGRPRPGPLRRPGPSAAGHVAGQRLDLLLLGLLLGRHLGHLLGVLTLGELELLREVGVAVDVPHVEEGGLLEADVHEGGLHAGQHPDHAPLVDVADDPLLALSLEVVLVDRAALDQGHARLRAGRVDHQDAVARHVGPRLPGPDEGMARPASGRERGRPGGAGDRGSPVEHIAQVRIPCARGSRGVRDPRPSSRIRLPSGVGVAR